MMRHRRKWWAKAVGGYGHRVTVCERRGSAYLHLRWWDTDRDNWRWRSLGHGDRERAEEQARQLAASLLAATEAVARGSLTVVDLFARFEDAVISREGARQAREDARRLKLWTTYLAGHRLVRTIDRTMLDRFVHARRRGELTVPGMALTHSPTERTVGADLEFLRRIFRWGAGVTRPDGTPLVDRNPLQGYPIPNTATPRRPVATYERYLAVRAEARGSFQSFLDLVEGLGWRVTALCRLRATDLDLTTSSAAPYGRIRKRGENDKEGVEMWVPMPDNVRAAVLSLLEHRPVVGEAYLFPAPSDPARPWTRYHARDLLLAAERRAGLTPLEGSAFHAYRRAWATARKHLPLKDVAAAGGWKSVETLLRCYTQPDDETMLAVVTEQRKVRSISGKP
jgi:integrase